MEIFKHEGDLLNVQEGIIVHGCNSKGVMESGIAKSIKEKYPRVYQDYRDRLRTFRNPVNSMGNIIFTTIKPQKLYVVSAITQEEYGRDKDKVYVSYEAMANAFGEISRYATTYGLDVHFPLIGCGLANGDWEKVEQIINDNLSKGVRKHLWILE